MWPNLSAQGLLKPSPSARPPKPHPESLRTSCVCCCFVYVIAMGVQEMTFNVDGISLLERGETPDEALAKELGKPLTSPPSRNSAT